ncbi:MAG: hypothetical protein V7641_3796 [Blastocatellia bacterium]
MVSRMINASEISQASEGAPLTVCANDCALDYGQSYQELAPVCFRLGCAFAEARWRNVLANNADLAHLVHIEVNQARSALRLN